MGKHPKETTGSARPKKYKEKKKDALV